MTIIPQTLSGKVKKNSLISKYSYTIGHNGGKQLKHQNINIDIEAFIQGFKDALAGENTVLSKEEMKLAIKEMYKLLQGEREIASKKNISIGKKYLLSNRQKKGVTVTNTGLQYRILKAGEGDRPGENDIVKVHYIGYFTNGKEFDNSYKKNRPAELIVSRLIKGWTEGLQLMKEGSKYKFVIPSSLAYGVKGNTVIPGNSVLIFEIELIEIRKK